MGIFDLPMFQATCETKRTRLTGYEGIYYQRLGPPTQIYVMQAERMVHCLWPSPVPKQRLQRDRRTMV
jgi:hypothetical protein